MSLLPTAPVLCTLPGGHASLMDVLLTTGETDATVIIKATPGSRRWQHMARGPGLTGQDVLLTAEDNYTIIFGSHRNTSLKVEKNGLPCSTVSILTTRTFSPVQSIRALVMRSEGCILISPQNFWSAATIQRCTALQVRDIPAMQLNPAEFRCFWIEYKQGAFRIGSGTHGCNVYMTWKDAEPIEGIRHIGLAAWDKFMAYRNIKSSAAMEYAPECLVSPIHQC